MNQQRLVDTFIELIKIDSESGDERRICDHLTKVFIDLGLDVTEDNSQPETGFGAGNLFINMPGDDKRDKLLFTCHMDTVTPGVNIKPEIIDNVIHSDKTTILGADDKAGIAVLIETIRIIREQNIPHGNIQFVITVGEESHLIGASALDKSLLNADYGYALDSGDTVGTIVQAAPTNATMTVNIEGKTAHAGVEPEKGVSAINIAARAVSQMKLGRIDEETTANIGRIEGGSRTNIVADSCSIIAEARSLRDEKMTAQVEHMKEAFMTAAGEMGGKANVDIQVSYPSFFVEEDSKVIDIAKKAAENIGRTSKVVKSGGGSDANYFNSYGIPTVVLAVGYRDIHTVNEQMPIDELVKLCEQTIEIIKLA